MPLLLPILLPPLVPSPRPRSPPGGRGPCPRMFPTWMWEAHDFSSVVQYAVNDPAAYHHRCVLCEGSFWRPGDLLAHFQDSHRWAYDRLYGRAPSPRDTELIKADLLGWERLLPPAPLRRRIGTEEDPVPVGDRRSRRRSRRRDRARSASPDHPSRRGRFDDVVKLETVEESPPRGASCVPFCDDTRLGVRLLGIGRGRKPIALSESPEALTLARIERVCAIRASAAVVTIASAPPIDPAVFLDYMAPPGGVSAVQSAPPGVEGAGAPAPACVPDLPASDVAPGASAEPSQAPLDASEGGCAIRASESETQIATVMALLPPSGDFDGLLSPTELAVVDDVLAGCGPDATDEVTTDAENFPAHVFVHPDGGRPRDS